MASFNELRKMDLKDMLGGRNKRNAPQDAQSNPDAEKNRLAVLNAPYQPSLPGVNVLPPEAVQRRRSRRLIRQFVTAGLAVVLFAAVCYGGSVGLGYAHQKQLDDVRATNSLLNSQLTQLQPYSSYQNSLDSARKTINSSLAGDLDVGRLLTDLNSVANRYGIRYTQINVSVNQSTGTAANAASASASSSSSTAAGGGQCFNPDPFTTSTSIGCISLSGSVSSQSGATAFFNQFNSQQGFLNGFISSLTTGNSTGTAASAGASNGRSSFNGTVAFDRNFYSNKYSSFATPLSSLISGTQGSSATSSGSTPSSSATPTPTPTLSFPAPLSSANPLSGASTNG